MLRITRFNRFSRAVSYLLLGALLGGCVSVLDATNDGPITTDPGKRNLGQYFSDEKLETIIAVNLRKASDELAAAHVNVLCFNSIVMLTGEVQSEEMKDLAAATASKISQVRQVHNELEVKSNSTFFSRQNDNWIETKIRTQIIGDGTVKIERIKVVVENGAVYLMGLVNRHEADVVSQIAAGVANVDRVVRVFEYIDGQ
jgi:osmotically-inducible protein OsmY